MLNDKQKRVKRIFDITLATICILLLWWLVILLFVVSTLDTKQNGIIAQKRIGMHGESFNILKIRTMKHDPTNNSYITVKEDKRITKIGHILRQLKIDELPQIINVLIGNMSFVGPRPDVAGFADKLQGEDAIILSVKPGITGPASIHFRDEETLLAQQEKPEDYNKNVIWPHKVRLNKAYIQNYSLALDIKYIIRTIF